MPTRESDSGLMQRGLILLGLIAVLAGVVLYVVLRRPPQDLPVDRSRPETVAVLVAAAPQSGFPAALPWAGLPQLASLLPSARGWEIRYNAALALARRGSPHVPLNVLREMLDEDHQMRNFRATLTDGQEIADESAARQTVLSALRALAEWQRHADAVAAVGASNPQLQQVYQALDRLAASSNLVVRTEAEKTRQALNRT
jgi:hypothetical protein